MVVDAKTILIVLIGAAVFALAQGLSGVLSVATQKKKVNRRLAVSSKVEGISALVVELRKQRGRRPVARCSPWTLPSASVWVRLNRKMSCICTTLPSIPTISVTWVTLRLPSERRFTWTTRPTAAAIW